MTHPQAGSACCAILLAAGRGTRFGGDKLMAPLDGIPLLEHVLRVLRQALEEQLIGRIIVVARPGARTLQALAAAHQAEVVLQPDPAGAPTSSLRVGLTAAAGADAVMIVLGDQPRLAVDTVRRLATTARQHPAAIVRARYSAAPEEPGHPVVVPSRWWGLHETPHGFRDAATAGAEVVQVPIHGSNPDVDTPEALRSLQERSG